MAGKPVKKKTRKKATNRGKREDTFLEADADDENLPAERSRILRNGLIFDSKKYRFSDQFVPANLDNPKGIHTTPELIEAIKKDMKDNKGRKIDIEARIICPHHKLGEGYRFVKMNKANFMEFAKTRVNSKRLREATDSFGFDQDQLASRGTIGNDFVPLLGGPFNKQLYYTDYLRMHAGAFHAYNHDPFGRAIVHITRDFTTGRGWALTWSGPDKLKAEAIWKSFAKVNDFDDFVEKATEEISIYGEIMIWWLPNNMKYIVQVPGPKDTMPTGLLPRIRSIDPSVIWEIVTHPEDITRKLYYQWVAPTQYQLYTGGNQPTLKFIFQQVPADQVMHYRVNSRSNEKRGRSDYFPALGYMKRLRDSVNYSIISLQKNAAYSLDTKIEGDQADIDAYVASQEAMGTIPEAGSEFVHTDKITREYLGNKEMGRGNSNAFDWTLSMIATTVQIPTNYFGTHLSGDQTRASALVATEPVAKKMENRQKLIGKFICAVAERVMREMNLNSDPEITWPEIVTEDRPAKLLDLSMAQTHLWMSNKKASQIANKELGVDNYDYESESMQIAKEQKEKAAMSIGDPLMGTPLTGDPKIPLPEPTGLTGKEKKAIKDNKGF